MNKIQEKFLEALLNVVEYSKDPQEYRYFWAIEEGFKRTDLYTKNTYLVNVTPTARKIHKCAENACIIKPEEKYFRLGDRYSPCKICVMCMAKMVHAQDVHLLPVYEFDYWDEDKQHPHYDSTSKHNTKMLSIVDNL